MIEDSNDAIALIVAAGSGNRAQSLIPKQYNKLGDNLIIEYSLALFQNDNRFKKIILVVAQEYLNKLPFDCLKYPKIMVIKGGVTRDESVFHGINAAKEYNPEHIFIHDAARPGIDKEIIDNLFAALKSHDGAIPCLSINDAIWQIEDDRLSQQIKRETLKRAQTPQAFNFTKFCMALDNRDKNKSYIDDAQIGVEYGLNIGFIDGKTQNDKITLPQDFNRIEKMLIGEIQYLPCVGNGFDAHKFCDGDFVTLCGEQIKHEYGLAGHSDADVAWHALVDAILGAIGEGDIGKAFPPSEAKWKGAASSIFLEFAAQKVREKNGKITNVDVTIICEAPRIGNYAAKLRENTANILGIKIERVNIKATTTEKMGFTGRKEGIAALASAMILLPDNID